MTIDFTLDPARRALQLDARRAASEVLSQVRAATRGLHTPGERFRATRPMYEEIIRRGFLRRLMPQPFGGEGTGMVDLAIVAEEFHAVDCNVSLTLFANLLGLAPLFIAGTPEQHRRLLAPFLACEGAPLAALANSEPGGSANFAAPRPGEGVRTTAVRDQGGEGGWRIHGTKQWVSAATGWDGEGADLLSVVCRTDPEAPPEAALSILVVRRGAPGLVPLHDIDAMGHRAHLVPRFRLDGVAVPDADVVGPVGGARDIVEASFSGTAALVGIMGVGLMRAAFDVALRFAKTECRGGALPIVEHQAVGYALADAKTTIEAARYLGWKACDAIDRQLPGALELALQSKIFGSEAAVRVITDLMRVVGIDSYGHELPLAGLLQDAIALPLFDGGNMGVRRRQLHALLRAADYDPLTAAGIA
ncbi:acyl-CoA dehydrogenase family protein [Variovorax sp. CY25R-8]|uniref:acyl-CoA dehydrogenase family protein n=1 Tax=Variovorax sp. CY25R-8 TaxID=2855501 RepID=UPI0021BBB3A7|nr:acyl-CoA dehydrogenase family protein [Variovorax sp. CY25R-8]MCT8180809.1 acyl-CoA dehydrogenase family protein [Variovorax sp. CY25R-8]